MKFRPSIKKFQMGGEMAPEQEPVELAPAELAPAPQLQQDPVMLLAQMAMQALQSQDCNMAMQVCQVFAQMMQGLGNAQAQPQGEPVFRKGGILVKRIRK